VALRGRWKGETKPERRRALGGIERIRGGRPDRHAGDGCARRRGQCESRGLWGFRGETGGKSRTEWKGLKEFGLGGNTRFPDETVGLNAEFIVREADGGLGRWRRLVDGRTAEGES